MVLQVNSLREEEHVSEDQLLFQAFSAMAHGAKAVSWACYSSGWWYHNVLDSEGNKTEQYEKLKSANAKIRALGNVCFDYNWSSAVRVNAGSKTDVSSFSEVAFTSDALIGSFNNENGVNAVFISPVEYDSKGTNTLTFKAEKADKVILHVAEGKRELTPDQAGLYRVELNGAEPCFITAE